jgi:hypothetical protein
MQLSGVATAPGTKPKMHKIVPTSKDWSLKATYVEVQSINASPNNRYTMTSFGIYYFLLNCEIRSVFLLLFAKIQKEPFF